MRTLLANALLVDGTGAPARPGSLLVKDRRIEAVGGGELAEAEAERVLDLGGAALAPGFIDTHSHSDLFLLLAPENPAKLRQGVTTEILGQDGIAMAPLPARYVGPWRKNLAGLEGDSDEVGWDWENMAGYLRTFAKKGVGPNVGCLAPHGNVRMEAMGLGDRPATEGELSAMCAILEREFEAGALGLSTGLIYIPCAYADQREMTALCATAARHRRPLVIHQRSEADDILASMREVLALGLFALQDLRQEERPPARTRARPARRGWARGHRRLLRPVPLRGREHHALGDPAALGPRGGHGQAPRAPGRQGRAVAHARRHRQRPHGPSRARTGSS